MPLNPFYSLASGLTQNLQILLWASTIAATPPSFYPKTLKTLTPFIRIEGRMPAPLTPKWHLNPNTDHRQKLSSFFPRCLF